MDEKKQIEEMAATICDDCRPHTPNCDRVICDSAIESAEAVYAAGYRRQSGWVSVDEEPTENGTYLCYGYWIGSGTYQMETADYIGEWDIVNNFVLTHWMPLPEAPKGE